MRGLKLSLTAAQLLLASETASCTVMPPVSSALHEQVIMLPVNAGGKLVELETTVYKPPGEGPFPLLLMNHGKNPGSARAQQRSRHFRLASVFVHKGYVVAIPMREGFARSDGHYPHDGCNILRHANDGAKDALAALYALTKLPYIDRTRILIAGQSDGGLVTMAMTAHPVAGVRGVINFSGGVRMEQCEGWRQNLTKAYALIGERALYPSLWFYGDNDRLWTGPLPQRMFAAFRSNVNGPAVNATMVNIGTFGKNSHDFADTQAGIKLWSPQVKVFIHELGLPF